MWRKCSSCKKPIEFGQNHYVCSVSTCNSPRTGYVFCSVICFENHLPSARHRDAVAIEERAPAQAAAAAAAPAAVASSPVRRIVASPVNAAPAAHQVTASRQEVLVIASRLKDYIQARSEFNTSQSVMDVLSHHLRTLCDRAIDNARADGRKTVMDRDFNFLKQ